MDGIHNNYILIALISHIAITYLSFKAYKEERTAHKLSLESGIDIGAILTICASFNLIFINAVRWASYGIIVFLLFNGAFAITMGLIAVRIFFITIMPINYVAVLRDFLSRIPSVDAGFPKVLRDYIHFVLQRGTIPL